MPEKLPPLRLTGALTLREGAMCQRTVAIAGGRISSGPYPAVDLEGYLVLPGIIDLGVEGLARHRAFLPLPDALRAAGREMAVAGVTTGCLVQDWGWEGPNSTPDAAKAAAEALLHLRKARGVRLHLRVETGLIDRLDMLEHLAERGALAMVSFTSHLPRLMAHAETDPAGFAHWASACGHDPAALLEQLRLAHKRRREVPRRLCRLAECFDRSGVIYGSLGDPDGETREMYSILGAKICADPASPAAAGVAKAVGDPTVLPAPRFAAPEEAHGARALLQRGKCQAIYSGGYPASLARIALRLAEDGQCSLPRAWELISSAPAQILRLPERGEIAPGKRADLVVIHAATQQVEATINKGRVTYLGGGAAERFVAASETLRIAAE